MIASPQNAPVRTDEEVPPHEELDITRYINGGRIIWKKPKQEMFYTRLPCYETYLRKTDKLKNERKVRIRAMMKYGALKSFLNLRDEQNLPLNQRGANGEFI